MITIELKEAGPRDGELRDIPDGWGSTFVARACKLVSRDPLEVEQYPVEYYFTGRYSTETGAAIYERRET